MKKISKEELKGPDAFVSSVDRFSRSIYKNRKTIFSILAIFLVVGLGVSLMSIMNTSKENKAQSVLFSAEKAYEKRKEEFKNFEDKEKKENSQVKTDEKEDKEKLDEKKEKDLEASKPTRKKTGEIEQDYGDIIPLFQTVLSEHKDTRAATVASIKLAQIYREHSASEKAVKVLETQLGNASSKDLINSLGLLMLGDLYENQKKCNEALKRWNIIYSDSSQKFMHSEVLLRMALCYENLDNTDKAKETYELISKDFAGTRAAKSAEKLKLLLALSKETK